jgi:peptidoglycan-associated lipoprotein
MSGSVKFKWLLLLFVALVLPNQQYSYAEPLDFKICGGGCMLLKLQPVPDPPPARWNLFVDSLELKDIFFENEEDVEFTLSETSRKVLKEIAKTLKNNSLWVVEIQSHADVLGKDRLYAIALGERRAHSTKMYLVSQGVSAKRIHTISYGKEKPFCTESSKECRQKNNRVHFRVNNG